MQQQSTSADEEENPTRHKRRRRRSVEDEHSKKDTSQEETTAATPTISNAISKKPPPPYGSQAYWEERYQAQFASLQQQQQQQQQQEQEPQTKKDSNQEDQEVVEEEEDTSTLAYHSWYFSYDELQPLLLPLLLGGREAARRVLLQQNSTQEDGEEQDEVDGHDESCEEDDDNDEVAGRGSAAVEKRSSSANQSKCGTAVSDRVIEEKAAAEEELENKAIQSPADESDNDDGFEFEEEDDIQSSSSDNDEDVDSSPDRQDGLASIDGPVAILELGCGDVPLGAALALELHELQQTTGSSARNIVKQILCTDYSPTVIETMRRQYGCKDSCTLGTPTTVTAPSVNIQQSSTTVDIGNVPLEFATVDARTLPYESNTFALVMEKGTLDAMLSDKTHGVRNCVLIVAECARVVKAGGCIMLVSHLNAHTANGMSWLQEVVFAGLQQSQQPRQNDNTGATSTGGSFTNGAPSGSNNNNNNITWEIEVHGHDEVPQEKDDEDDGIESSRFPPNSAGPAVYIIHKKTKVVNDDSLGNGTTDVGDSSHRTIPVKFFTY